MKTLIILGSTGSIGTQALEVIKNNPAEFKVRGLACNSNISLLKKQIEEFKPEAVAVFDEEKADELKNKVDIEVFFDMDGLIELAKLYTDYTIIKK